MVVLSTRSTARDRLIARRTELLHRIRYASDLADELADDRTVEVVDRATDHWDSQVLGTLGDTESKQLAAVIAALRRLTDGTYGRCIRCRRRIAKGRLDALPEASLCADCARYLKR